MAQTSYEEYLSKLMGDAYNQPTQGGLMSPVAMPDVSPITAALQKVSDVNKSYQAPQMSDLNKVREDFLAKKAEEAQKQVQELLAATPQSSGGGYGDTGMLSDAAFDAQLSQGIMNVQTLANMGLISPETAAGMIADALGKMGIDDFNPDPGAIADYGFTPGGTGTGAGGYDTSIGTGGFDGAGDYGADDGSFGVW